MPNTVTPNMALVVPTVGSEPGPAYANDVNNSLTTIDGHTHQAGSGVPITPLAMNINSDLPFNQWNINNIRSIRMVNNGSTLSGASDVCSVYVDNGNLYYNNNAGVPVQITTGSSINSTTTVQYNYAIQAVASDWTINSSDTYSFLNVNTSGGTYFVQLPHANAVAAGRFYLISDKTGNAGVHNFSIIPNSGDTVDGASTYALNVAYQTVLIISDGVSNWNVMAGTKTTYVSGDVVTFGSSSQLKFQSATLNMDSSSSIVQAGSNTFTSTSSTTFNNGSTTTFAVGSHTTFNSGANLTFSGGSSQLAIPSTTRTIFTNLVPLSLGSSTTWAMNQNGGSHLWSLVGICQVSLTGATSNAFVVDIPKHNGATLVSVTMFWTAANNTLPAQVPTMSIYRAKWAANAVPLPVVYLNSSDGGVGAGLPITSATNGTQYFNSGAMQAYTYLCNQNNVIDTSQYTYGVQIVGEFGSGATAGDLYFGMSCGFTGITSMQFP